MNDKIANLSIPYPTTKVVLGFALLGNAIAASLMAIYCRVIEPDFFQWISPILIIIFGIIIDFIPFLLIGICLFLGKIYFSFKGLLYTLMANIICTTTFFSIIFLGDMAMRHHFEIDQPFLLSLLLLNAINGISTLIIFPFLLPRR